MSVRAYLLGFVVLGAIGQRKVTVWDVVVTVLSCGPWVVHNQQLLDFSLSYKYTHKYHLIIQVIWKTLTTQAKLCKKNNRLCPASLNLNRVYCSQGNYRGI